MNTTKHTLVACLFALAFAFFGADKAFASVTVTAASGGGSISADTAANAPAPGWTALGAITIAEGKNSDFATGTGVTLILQAPAGYQFNTAVTPSISFTASADISSAAIAVTSSSTITITLAVTGTSHSDTLTIGSTTAIQVQPTASTPLASGNITVATTSTESVNGITDGTTSMGALAEVGGAVTQLAFTTQPAGATAGAVFGTQPVLKSEDQFGNASTNGLPATSYIALTLSSGTGPLQGTTSTNLGQSGAKGVITFTNLRIDVAGSNDQLTATSTNGWTSAVSSVFTVNAAAASKLVINTQPSSTATAGVVFGQQPVIYVQDAYNNTCTTNSTVTATRSAGAGTLQGTTNVAAVAGVVTYTSLAQGWATNITIAFTSTGLTAATSSVVAVSPNSYSQLLVVAPGQTNAPGTTSGVGGTASAQTAGTAFAVKVLASDAYGNLVSTNDTVAITSSDATAVLPANAALVNGTNSFSLTMKDAGSQTVTATDTTEGQTGTSSAITVNGAAFAKLQLLMPGESAAPGTGSGKTGTPNTQTAGASYSVTVNAVDANWNLINTNDTVGITTTDPNDVLPANAALVGGTKTFSLTNKTAGTWTMTASNITHTGIAASTSPSFTVNPNTLVKLQLLMPGEAASPGSSTGKSGSPTAQSARTPLNVTVNAVDANWNLVNSASDTVGITSSDSNASLPPNAALSGGTGSFTVVFETAGSQTVTASDITNGGISPNTGTATTVGDSAFYQLQVLMPGETAAPGTTTGKTGTPTVQTAGTAFNVTVRSVDASWNLISTNDTVHLASTDAQATLAANTALSSGTVTLSVTFKTSDSQTVTASDVTHTGIGSNTGTATTVNPAAASKLVINTQPSSTATAGVVFGQQPVIYIEDTYSNLRSNDTLTVTATRSAGAGTLQGTTNVAAVAGVVTYTSLAQGWATNITIAFTSTGLTAATSSVVAVSPNSYSQLLVVAPGQTNAPGTTSGVGGTASAQTAGTAFAVKVLASDAYGNLVSTNDTVAITSSDATAVLPANAALVNGTNSFSLTMKDAGSQTVTATDTTEGQTGTSSAITVNGAAFAKLQLLMPGESAAPGTGSGKTGTPNTQTAGASYSVTVNAVDANWNLINTNDTVGITTTDPNDVLPANAALVGGTKTFSLTNKTAGTWTMTASNITHTGIAASTSPSFTVNPNTLVKLQLLMPGEAASPGSSTGKSGSPTAQSARTPLNVTVNAVDANWNLVNSASDTVGITSSDSNASLPPNAALSGGTGSFTVVFETAGSQTVTASDITNGGISPNTGTATTVGDSAFYQLQVLMPGETAAPGTTTGKTGTPTVQTAGTAFNVTVRSVDASWNLISTNDTVHLASTDAQATLAANTALSSGTVTLSVTFKTSDSQTVTASDVTHTGIGSNTGTATTVNPAAASKLVINTQPSSTATAGVVFGQQPVIYIEDTYSNLRSNDTLTVTATRSAGAGTLLGTTNVAAVAGVVTYTSLAQGWATNITIAFTSGALTAATSSVVAVSPNSYSQLLVVAPGQTNAPGTTSGVGGTASAQTAGTAFAVKVLASDAYGNLISTNDTVGITSSDATAGLPANAALVNGTNSFSITMKDAGSQTVTATDTTEGQTGTSSAITVNGAAFAKLQLLMPGESAAPGTTSGKTGSPNEQTAGASYSVTVNAVDANWNLISTNDTIAITSSDANATLPANAALASGTKTFSVTNKTAGSWTVTASDSTHTGITANTGSSFTVNPNTFVKLQVLMPGESASPGSATGESGSPTAQSARAPVNVTVNAVDANWNLVNSASDTVGITSSDSNASLPPSAALSGGTGSFTVVFETAGSQTVTASDLTNGGISPNTGTATTVNAGAFAKLQILLPGQTAAPGTGSGQTGNPTAQTAGTGYTVTVNAVDASYNLVSTNDTVAITSSDANAGLPANAAMASGTKTFSVTNRTVGSWTVTASDATHAGVTAATSSSVTVNVGAFAKLQLLVPGETAAPGSASGLTGTPSAQTAGASYSVTVNAVDANWNLISTNDTVGITSSDTNATLAATNALAGGTQTFSLTNKTAGSWTVTASDKTHTGITASTSPSITVSAGALAKLQLLLPGQTAAAGTTAGETGTPSAETAGTAFNVTVNGVDANWNVVNTVSDTVGITASDTNAALPAATALAAGTKTLSVTLKTVGSATVTASDTTNPGITASTSPSITVNLGAFAKLQLLMPGETAAAGTTSGKTGTPNAQAAGASYSVTVNAVDANWNLISTNDTIAITSSDANATLPASAALVTGTKTFSVTNKTAGSWTVTASDTTHTGITANTGSSFTVNPNAFVKLQVLMPGETAAPGTSTGKASSPSAQSVNTPLNVTVNAVDANWNLVNTGTDTVKITSTDTNAALSANAALIGGTGSFAVVFQTAGSQTVTATDVTNGGISPNTGTATTVNAGAFAQLQILLPGQTAAPGTSTGQTGSPTAQTAGTGYTVTVNAVDASYNVVSTNDTVAITSSDSNAGLPANAAMASGTKTFSVTNKTVGSWTVTASDVTHAGITAATSSSVTVNVGALAKLQLLVPGEAAAPGTATGMTGTPAAEQAGTGYSVVVNAVDANWNLVGTNDIIAITSSDTHASLPANTALVAGTVTLSLTNNTAGSWTVTASDTTHTGVTANTSPSITVTAGAFAKLQLLMPGETAAAGSATGKTGTPSARTAGTAFNVTVNGVDANWNLVNTVSDTVGITASDANAVLPANAALSSGTKAFSVTFHTAGSQTVTATDATDGTKTPNTSPATTVNSGAVDHYAVAVSSPNNAGVPFTTTVTAQDSFNNTVTTNTATVTLTGTGSVQFDSNGDRIYGDNTKALTSGVLTIATKDNFAETVNITATANSKTGTLTGLVITPAIGAYESVATGNWNDPTIWNTYDGSSWDPATVPPASTNAPTITIQSSNTVTVTAAVTVDQVIVQTNGQITVSSGQTLTLTNGTSTDLDIYGAVNVLGTLPINSGVVAVVEAGGAVQDGGLVNVLGTFSISTGGAVEVNTNGILSNAGTLTSTASTLAFDSGATYQHTYTTAAGTIPTATWNTNSACAVIGYTSNTTAPAGLGQTFGNFTWNCPSQTGAIDLGGALTTVKGNLTVTGPGSSEMRPSGNLTVGGNYSQTAGTFRVTGSGTHTLTVSSNFALSGGTFDLTSAFFTTGTLDVGGNFGQTGGTITLSGTLATGNIVFDKAGAQTYTSGGTVNGVNFTVNSGSTLVMGTNIITGSGTFTLSSGAGLQIGSPAGITTSGATGNIQATGTRTFNTGASYTYNGIAAQVTGNGLPATNSNLTISNSAGVTLSASTTVTNALTLTNGVLTTGTNRVAIAAAGSIAGGGSTSYVNGTLQKAFNTGASQSFTYPIGDASEYAPFSVASLSVTAAGSLAAKTTDGQHPDIATSGIDSTRDVSRYWTLTNGGSFAATGNPTFNYLTNDVAAAATASQFVVRRYSTNAWQTTTLSGTPTTTATTISGAIASGDFAIGDQAINHYVVSAATPQTVNTPFPTTVTAYDILNQPVTGDSSTVVTMTGSTNTVQFDSNGDGIFGDNTKTLSGGTITISTEDTIGGTITLTATDANSKTGTSSPIVVNGAASQTISFGPLTNQTYGNAPFTVSATASSGLPVTFSIFSGPATVAGNTVTITGAGTVTVEASQAGNGTWKAATNVNQSFTVAPAQLTVTASAQSKTYGQIVSFGSGSTQFTSSGLQNSDTIGSVTLAVSGNGGAGTAPVGSYTITPSAATGTTFTAANYNITYNTGTLTVNPATLNVSASGTLVYGQDPSNAVYSPFYYPLQGTDTVSVIAGSADFTNNATATNYVGSNYVVTVLDTGTLAAANYSFAVGTNGIMTITPASLTVTNLLADDKTYDGTTNATLDASGAGLDGLVNGDDVTLNTNNEAGAFADKNAGTDKPVTVSGLALSGDLGTNYTLVQPTPTANIWPLAITVTAASDTKVYDGTTSSVGVPTSSPALATGDSGSFTQTFDTRNVGTGKTLTPAGTVSDGNGGANYSITFAAVTTGEIDPAPITVTAVTDTKPYDGTISSVGAPTYTALAAGDSTVSLSQTFDTRNAGTGKTLTPMGVVNDGNGGLNYNYTYATVATGEIDPASLTVTAAPNTKPYDGTTSAAATPTLTAGTIQTGDTAPIWTETYDTKNAGTGKTLTPAGTVIDGNGGNNYSVSFLAVNTGVIIAQGLTVTGITANDKVYDGTTTATLNTGSAALAGSITNGDNVTLQTGGASGAFTDSNAGTGKTVIVSGLTLGGTDAVNYTLTQPTTAADITPASSAIAVTSSANPSLPGSNVTFTASVSVLPPGGGAVGGTVQFVVDGAPFGTPAALSAGTASLNSSALAHGYHTVAAEYADNGNFYGSTNSLSPNQLVNTPPVGANVTMTAYRNQSTNLSAARLALVCTDADGDALTITAVVTNSAQGGTVSLSGETITYTPPANYTGADSFTYTVSDTFGATGTGTITVTVQALQVSLVIQTLSQLPDGNMEIMASGIPGDTYLIQASTDLNTWTAIGTNAADSNGIIAFPDLSATNFTSRFYRLAAP